MGGDLNDDICDDDGEEEDDLNSQEEDDEDDYGNQSGFASKDYDSDCNDSGYDDMS